MKKYEIPPRLISGFESLIKIGDSEINTIIDLIKSFPVGTPSKEFVDSFTNKIDIENKEILGSTIYSFGELLDKTDGTTEELVKDILYSFNEDVKREILPTELESLEKNLNTIFNNCQNLKKTFKAVGLLTDNDKLLIDSRIVSDIRLIFDDDIREKNRNAVIIHKLKLEYQHSRTIDVVYITLDKSDLKKLQEHIKKALDKEDLIKKDYDSIKFVDISA